MYLDWLLLCATHIGLDNRGSGCPKKFARTLCISSSGWSKVPLRCTTAASCAGVSIECICLESVLGVPGLIALGTPLDASTSVCRIRHQPSYSSRHGQGLPPIRLFTRLLGLRQAFGVANYRAAEHLNKSQLDNWHRPHAY